MSHLPADVARCTGDRCPSAQKCQRHTNRPAKGETATYAAFHVRREAGASACDHFMPAPQDGGGAA